MTDITFSTGRFSAMGLNEAIGVISWHYSHDDATLLHAIAKIREEFSPLENDEAYQVIREGLFRIKWHLERFLHRDADVYNPGYAADLALLYLAEKAGLL